VAEISLKIKSLIEPVSRVSQSTDDERLNTVLSLTESSHEPVLVFDKNERLLGLISPTQALFKRQLPPTTKVASVVVPPPHLTLNNSLTDIVNQMLSTRFYILPIFEDKHEIAGVIRAQTIFKKILRLPNRLKEVSKKLKTKTPVTVTIHHTVKDAHEFLKTKKISRLVVVDHEKKVIGVVTRNDLKNAFIKPTPRQRFSKSSGEIGQAMYDEEKINRNDMPLGNFLRNDVAKIHLNALPSEIIKRLIKSKRNSLILVDKYDHPKAIISNRDILLAISNVDDEVDVPIIINKPKRASGFTIDEVENRIIEMGKKINRILPLKRFEVSFKENKNAAGKANQIETTLSAKFYSGDDFVVKYANHRILVSVAEVLNRIYKMVRRGKDKKIRH
jgi:CBS domain-containing protein